MGRQSLSSGAQSAGHHLAIGCTGIFIFILAGGSVRVIDAVWNPQVFLFGVLCCLGNLFFEEMFWPHMLRYGRALFVRSLAHKRN